VLMLVLVTFGCKKKESEPSQQTVAQEKLQPATTSEPVKATKPAGEFLTASTDTDTESETVETTIAAEPTETVQNPETAHVGRRLGQVNRLGSVVNITGGCRKQMHLWAYQFYVRIGISRFRIRVVFP